MQFNKVATAAAVGFVLACTSVAAQDADRTGWPESFTVGTASQGGTYFAYGSGWANLVAEELGLSGGGEVTGGPMPAGAKIGFGPAGSTSDTYFPRIMESLGIEFERRNGGWSDLGGQLQDGLLDVIAFAAGVPVPAVSQLEVQTDVNIIEFTEEEQATILAEFPVSEFSIASDTYTTLEADARSVSMWNFSIANCDLPESFVEAVVDVVMSDNERMMNIHKAARSTVPENWDKNEVLMWHPGAAKWFRENAGADIADDRVYGG